MYVHTCLPSSSFQSFKETRKVFIAREKVYEVSYRTIISDAAHITYYKYILQLALHGYSLTYYPE